jgi:hypothetical protein
MIGSDPNLVASVVPIVAFFALAFWLGLCFYAGSHPYWRHQQQPATRQELASSGQAGPLPPPATQNLSGSAARATGGAADEAPGLHRVAPR